MKIIEAIKVDELYCPECGLELAVDVTEGEVTYFCRDIECGLGWRGFQTVRKETVKLCEVGEVVGGELGQDC